MSTYRRYDSTVVAAAPIADADALRAPSERTAVAASSASGLDTQREKQQQQQQQRRRRLPTWFAYPLSMVLSLAFSAVLYSFVPDIAGVRFAAVSRSLNESWQIGALVAWKVAEITTGWIFGLDHFDFAQLSLVANVPYYTLLYLFFGLALEPLVLAIAIDMFSLWFPFYLLRPLNYHNNFRTTTDDGTTRELAVDKTIVLYMTIFAASIYGAFVYLSLWSWLPVFVINHFDEVFSLDFAHNAVFPVVLGACLPLGYAAQDFLFSTSIVYARASPADAPKFDPRTASLTDTVMWNVGVGQYSTREAVLIRRTLLLVAFTFLHAFVRVFGTIEGATAYGAAGWSALWAVAAGSIGYGFLYIGDA